jgi:UDP-3-O-[3-hydroxymyristoyl] glucosamine N-acyltransferase
MTFSLAKTVEKLGEGKLIQEGTFKQIHKASYAQIAQTMTFIESSKYLNLLSKNENISAVICTPEMVDRIKGLGPLGIVTHPSPKELFYKIHYYINSFKKAYRPTFIDPSSKISSHSIISDCDVTIGKNCLIEEGVIVKPGVFIDDNTVVRSGSILGAEGFEIANSDGMLKLIPHLGSLSIGKNVNILSNCTVCKAIFDNSKTVISDQVFLDCLVHIAHGVFIGKGSKLAANAVIAGNVTIGENVWIGPGATLRNGINIGNKAFIALGSVLIHDLKANEKVSGNFAVNHDENLLNYIKIQRGK